MGQLAKTREFNLDNLSLLWQEFETRKKRLDEDTKWIEEFKAQIDKLSGGAEVYTYRGAEVASYRQNGNLSLAKLTKEQPDLVSRYTEVVAEQKFNKERFQMEQPEVYEKYRAKVWRMNKGVALDLHE